MSISATARPVYTNVLFGQPTTHEGLEAFTLTRDDFEVLGCKVLTHLGRRISDFRLVTQMFELQCTALTELNAFLILEEIAILIEEMTDTRAIEHLRKIEHALHSQVYREFRAVAYLVH